MIRPKKQNSPIHKIQDAEKAQPKRKSNQLFQI